MTSLGVGEQVRFSAAGVARVRSMPEAWGLHTALRLGEVGRVTEWDDDGPDGVPQVVVEFPSGSAYYWDVACFERATQRRTE